MKISHHKVPPIRWIGGTLLSYFKFIISSVNPQKIQTIEMFELYKMHNNRTLTNTIPII